MILMIMSYWHPTLMNIVLGLVTLLTISSKNQRLMLGWWSVIFQDAWLFSWIKLIRPHVIPLCTLKHICFKYDLMHHHMLLLICPAPDLQCSLAAGAWGRSRLKTALILSENVKKAGWLLVGQSELHSSE